MEKILNYINGQLVEPTFGKYLENINPSIGSVYSLIPDSDTSDVQLAVQSAQAAFPLWSAMPLEKRASILLAIADLIDRDIDKLALAESIDQGKPLKLACAVDIPRASANMRFYATASMHMSSESHLMEGEAINYDPNSDRCCRMHLTMESSLILIHLENCPRIGSRLHSGCKTLRAYAHDSFFIFKVVC